MVLLNLHSPNDETALICIPLSLKYSLGNFLCLPDRLDPADEDRLDPPDLCLESTVPESVHDPRDRRHVRDLLLVVTHENTLLSLRPL